MGRTMEGKLQRYLAITQTLTITIAIVVTTTITQGRAMQRGQVLIPKEFAGCNFKDSWIAGQLAVEHVGGFTQHTEEKLDKCNACGNLSTSAQLLRMHSKTHTHSVKPTEDNLQMEDGRKVDSGQTPSCKE